MVELAVVSPVLIALAFMGAWLTEVVRARLVNQGVAHDLVWQLAGRLPVDADWEQSRALAEAAASTPPPQVTGLTFFQVSLQREDSGLGFPPPAPGGSAVASVFLAQGTSSLLHRWGSAQSSQLEAESQLRVRNPIPLPWRDPGRADGLTLAFLSASEVIWADDGHLDDGGDVRPGGRDATRGLFQRVQPLTYLGQAGAATSALQPLQHLPFLPDPLPMLAGTFLSSSAYRSGTSSVGQCDGIPGYVRAVGSESGLQDFMGPEGNWLDAVHPQCFDTAPFRDVHAYPRGGGSPGNLSMQQFLQRGDFFMGCQTAMEQLCEGGR